MTLTDKLFYVAAFVTGLVAWIPAIAANRNGQQKRLIYLAPVILYLSVQAIYGCGACFYPRDNPAEIWLWPHGYGGRGAWLFFPLGFGLPLCWIVLGWDALGRGRSRQQVSDAALQARIAQELAAQKAETERKDYW